MDRRTAYNKLKILQLNEDELIDDYVSRVKLLTARIDSLEKAAFLSGLPLDVAVHVEKGGDLEMEEMIQRSRKYLAIKRSISHNTSVFVERQNPISGERGGLSAANATTYKKPQRFEEGNINRAEESRSQSSRRHIKKIERICFRCRKPGHIAKYCQAENYQGSA